MLNLCFKLRFWGRRCVTFSPKSTTIKQRWRYWEQPIPLIHSVKRHLSRRHLSVLNFNCNFIFNGGCTREEQIALSLKRHLFPHGGTKPKAFRIYSLDAAPHLEYFFRFFELSTKAAFAKAAFDTLRNPGVCKWWSPNGGSSFVGERNSATSILPQFYLCFTSVLPLFNLFFTSL